MITLPTDQAHTLPSVASDYSDTLRLHNLHINAPKPIVYCNNDLAFPTDSLPYATSRDGFHVCRVAVGTPQFIASHTLAIVAQRQCSVWPVVYWAQS